MSRWTYYSPLWLGLLLVLGLNEPVRGLVTWPDWAEWLLVVGVGLAVGLAGQVLMAGVQGAFAQVLPVPGGRSIRGGPAMTGGWLLIAGMVVTAVAALFGFEAEVPRWLVLTSAGLAAACLLGALVVYVWNLPAADTDFRGGDT